MLGHVSNPRRDDEAGMTDAHGKRHVVDGAVLTDPEPHRSGPRTLVEQASGHLELVVADLVHFHADGADLDRWAIVAHRPRTSARMPSIAAWMLPLLATIAGLSRSRRSEERRVGTDGRH